MCCTPAPPCEWVGTPAPAAGATLSREQRNSPPGRRRGAVAGAPGVDAGVLVGFASVAPALPDAESAVILQALKEMSAEKTNTAEGQSERSAIRNNYTRTNRTFHMHALTAHSRCLRHALTAVVVLVGLKSRAGRERADAEAHWERPDHHSGACVGRTMAASTKDNG